MNCNKTDCIHYKVCQEWKSLDNDNYINDSYGNCENYNPTVVERLQGDLISRSALIEEVQDWVDPFVLTFINNAPTVEPDMEFAKWVTKMIFGNNEVEDFDFELFSELACRKLEKIGLVEKTESEWTKKGEEE